MFMFLVFSVGLSLGAMAENKLEKCLALVEVDGILNGLKCFYMLIFIFHFNILLIL